MSEALNVVKAAVSKTRSEDAALAKVVQALAATRYTSKPTVGTAKHDGVNLRVYHWSNTPLGDLLLFTGSSLDQSVLVAASELDHSPKSGMVYIPVSLSDPAAKAGQKKLETILSGKRVKQIQKKAAEEGVPKAPKPAAQRVARPKQAARPKPAYDMDAFRAARAAGRARYESKKASHEQEERMARFRDVRVKGREQFLSKKAAASSKASEKAELVGGLKDLLSMLG